MRRAAAPDPGDPGFAGVMRSVDTMRVRDVRAIFAIMRRREGGVTADTLLTAYGLTVGEFSTAYVLNQHANKRGAR